MDRFDFELLRRYAEIADADAPDELEAIFDYTGFLYDDVDTDDRFVESAWEDWGA